MLLSLMLIILGIHGAIFERSQRGQEVEELGPIMTQNPKDRQQAVDLVMTTRQTMSVVVFGRCVTQGKVFGLMSLSRPLLLRDAHGFPD